jgi:transposase InsO family protein
MPWKVNAMTDIRREFLELALKDGSNMTELCAGFSISRKTGYKWVARYHGEGVSALANQSRRPKSSPGQTSAEVEALVVSLREAHPAWGGRKLRRRLQDTGVKDVPAASTITEILRRREKLTKPERAAKFIRFERSDPNELWQMDFKGHFELGSGKRCHPLTVVDDHSRYAVVLQACSNEQHGTVQEHLRSAFRHYGLPQGMLMDNGSPWGSGTRDSPWTALTVWLLRLGIRVSHGRPRHPQTQGKEERFHRTLKAEVLQGAVIRDYLECQARFDSWRVTYNHERPHEALELAVPGTRYCRSQRVFPEQLAAMEFSAIDQVRKVHEGGWIAFQGREWNVSRAFTGECVGVRPTTRDGEWEVWFGPQCLGMLDQHTDAENRRLVRRPRKG